MFAVDFHTHTYHSYDSMMGPEKILRLAKQRGLSGIVVSDHDTIQGGLECASINRDKDLKVFVGSEIKTSVGDITGINLKQEITDRNFTDVVQQIKNQGGLVLLVHPYHHHKLDEINFDAIDLVEGFNAREFPANNLKAVELAKKYGKPIIAGSDAHVYSEIGNAKTFYRNLDDLTQPVSTECRRNSLFAEPASQFIKAYKRGSPELFYKWMKWVPKYLVRRMKVSDT
jgi:predicted metal-dependent phosphoesterase TrpH